MPLAIDGQPKDYLVQGIKRGRAYLALGAGASKTCRNRHDQDVRLGWQLAEVLAAEASLPFSGEPLTVVLNAIVPDIISRNRFHEILQDQYLRVHPSDELTAVLQYVWKRIYTWNIDDSLENIRSTVQSRKFFNGVADFAYTNYELDEVAVIHLHGEAHKPDFGFIFSEE